MCFLRVFKNFLKVVRVGKKWSEGVKMGVKWGKKSVPESAYIHYLGPSHPLVGSIPSPLTFDWMEFIDQLLVSISPLMHIHWKEKRASNWMEPLSDSAA